MINKLYFLFFALLLSSCSNNYLSHKQISSLNNNELCKALSIYRKNSIVLDNILKEIEYRKKYLNQHECNLIAYKQLNYKHKNNNLRSNYWNNEINKYYHELGAKTIQKLNKNKYIENN
nr:MAG: hypothetical protein ACHINZ_6100 [Candidatus Aschnera chinzeii]